MDALDLLHCLRAAGYDLMADKREGFTLHHPRGIPAPLVPALRMHAADLRGALRAERLAFKTVRKIRAKSTA